MSVGLCEVVDFEVFVVFAALVGKEMVDPDMFVLVTMVELSDVADTADCFDCNAFEIPSFVM